MNSLIKLRVRYQETDQMGFAHHSVYLVWFEAGRTEWLREQGLSYRECEAKGWLLPLVESGCKYLQPARYDDLIEIETSYREAPGLSFSFEYQARNTANGELLTTGFTKHVCIDRHHKINRIGSKLLKEFLKNTDSTKIYSPESLE